MSPCIPPKCSSQYEKPSSSGGAPPGLAGCWGRGRCRQKLYQAAATSLFWKLLWLPVSPRQSPFSPQGAQPTGASHLPRTPLHSPSSEVTSSRKPSWPTPLPGIDSIHHTPLSVGHSPPQMVSPSRRRAQYRHVQCVPTMEDTGVCESSLQNVPSGALIRGTC